MALRRPAGQKAPADAATSIGKALAGFMVKTQLGVRAGLAQTEVSQGVKKAEAVLDRQGAAIRSETRALFQSAAANANAPAPVRNVMRALAGPLGGTWGIVLGVLVAYAVGTSASAVFDPFFEEQAQDSWRSNPVRRLSPERAADALRRGLLTPDEAADEALAAGVNERRFAQLVELQRRLLAPGELLDATNRGELDPGEARIRLAELGYSADDIDLLLAEPAGDAPGGLRFAFPPVADLIRFAVREVFSPDVAGRFGLADDFPADFARLAGFAGLPEHVARWYWSAHWDLPSIGQGMEMLHRGVIDDAELDLLLRAADVMPFWRDKLKAIAFAPLTRVDVRRMYHAGVIDRERVYRAYRDLGYDDGNARALTEWTTRDKLADDRALTKSEVLALFEARTLTRADAGAMLAELGYSADETAFLFGLAEHRREQRRRDAAVRVVHGRYASHRIDAHAASTALDRLEVPADERELLLDLWTLERELNTREVTDAQLAALLKRGTIDTDRYRRELGERGYSAESVEWLVTLNTPAKKPQEAARDTESR